MDFADSVDHAARQQSDIAWGFNPRIENRPIMCPKRGTVVIGLPRPFSAHVRVSKTWG